MVSHSFAYLTVIAAATLIMACLTLYIRHLRGELRELRRIYSRNLSSTTAEALAHMIQECETPLAVELPEPEAASVPPIPEAQRTDEDHPVLAEVRAACWVAAQHGRRQCSHHSR